MSLATSFLSICNVPDSPWHCGGDTAGCLVLQTARIQCIFTECVCVHA